MEKQLISLPTKLWHPYRKSEGTRANQGTARVEDYPTDTSDTARPDWVNSGL